MNRQTHMPCRGRDVQPISVRATAALRTQRGNEGAQIPVKTERIDIYLPFVVSVWDWVLSRFAQARKGSTLL